MKETFKVVDKAGLHARPASLISAIASKYSGDVNIIYNGKSATLKSILIVMSLGIPFDASFEIEVIGEDETKPLDQIREVLIENGII